MRTARLSARYPAPSSPRRRSAPGRTGGPVRRCSANPDDDGEQPCIDHPDGQRAFARTAAWVGEPRSAGWSADAGCRGSPAPRSRRDARTVAQPSASRHANSTSALGLRPVTGRRFSAQPSGVSQRGRRGRGRDRRRCEGAGRRRPGRRQAPGRRGAARELAGKTADHGEDVSGGPRGGDHDRLRGRQITGRGTGHEQGGRDRQPEHPASTVSAASTAATSAPRPILLPASARTVRPPPLRSGRARRHCFLMIRRPPRAARPGETRRIRPRSPDRAAPRRTGAAPDCHGTPRRSAPARPRSDRYPGSRSRSPPRRGRRWRNGRQTHPLDAKRVPPDPDLRALIHPELRRRRPCRSGTGKAPPETVRDWPAKRPR